MHLPGRTTLITIKQGAIASPNLLTRRTLFPGRLKQFIGEGINMHLRTGQPQRNYGGTNHALRAPIVTHLDLLIGPGHQLSLQWPASRIIILDGHNARLDSTTRPASNLQPNRGTPSLRYIPVSYLISVASEGPYPGQLR